MKSSGKIKEQIQDAILKIELEILTGQHVISFEGDSNASNSCPESDGA